MAIITLFSVAGAPGTTTTALAVALSWPRRVMLVDADPTASAPILAGWLKGQQPHSCSIVDLVIAQRHGQVAETLKAATLQLPNSNVAFMPGVQAVGQAASVAGLWPDLLPALADLDEAGMDVIIDAGRLSAQHAPIAAISGADLAVLVTRSTLPALAAVRAWQPTVEASTDSSAFGLAIVGPGRPNPSDEIRRVFKLPILATMAFDPVNADVFAYGEDPARPVNPKHFNTSAMVQSARAAAAALHQAASRRRAAIHTPIAEGGLS
jgi:MinD-like ATPase involved in chromosome partitioning or flagellar assembly